MKSASSIVSRLNTNGNWNRFTILFFGFILIAGLGFLDFLTGFEYSFSLFYLLPIVLLIWYAGRWFGIAAAVISAVVWGFADKLSGNYYSSPIIYYWNSAIRLSFFFIVALLLAALKKTLENEKALSRTDNLTGVATAKYFYDLLQIEIDRSQRYQHPFTLAYMDLDNFKDINDQYGHSEGDDVLRSIGSLARNEFRKTDIVARLGGDEFAILFPETDQKTARVAVSKVQNILLKVMKKNNWPVTFSIGVVTFVKSPTSANDLIKMADDLMYTVKRNGKNAIKFKLYSG